MKALVTALLVLAVTGCGENDPFRAKTVDQTKSEIAAIESRIKPFSQVNLAGSTTVAVAEAAALPGESKFAGCTACHGANGGGGVGPALAGQTAAYITDRLNTYRNGDKVGAQSNMMWGQAAGLSDQDITDIAEYVESL